MSFIDAVKTCFSKYVTFSGRARRSEYWWWFLFAVIVYIVSGAIDAAAGTYPIIYAICILAIFLPTLAVTVRRLHDTGRSGWWILLGLIPLVGSIILIVFYCQDSQGPNKYGENPKFGSAAPGGPVPPPYQPPA